MMQSIAARWAALLLIAFLVGAETPNVIGEAAASDSTKMTQTTAEAASQNARRARPHVRRHRTPTRSTVPSNYLNRPGLDRCGISAVLVCPWR